MRTCALNPKAYVAAGPFALPILAQATSHYLCGEAVSTSIIKFNSKRPAIDRRIENRERQERGMLFIYEYMSGD